MTPKERPTWWTTDDWATPPAFVRRLEREFGTFEIDPCAANRRVAKAVVFYTPEQDGLRKPWNGRVFCNPPYSDVRPWARRAA